MSDLKTTPLNAAHRALGAKMVEFGGWDMPVQYSGIIDEHTATRTAAGLFDICHMGEFTIEGPGALELIQKVSTNNASKLAVGQCHYACMLNEDGGTIDDCIIYRKGGDSYMMVVNAGPRAGDFAWLEKHNTTGAVLNDISDATAKLDLQGPKSRDILALAADPETVNGLKYFRFAESSVCGVPGIISRTGYTGELGFELYIPADKAETVWNGLLEKGSAAGLKPVGLGARDTLRLEMGYSLYGHELDTDTSPLEAGLGWIVKLDKDGFVGKEVLDAQKADGCPKQLIAFIMEGRQVPRHGYPIVSGGSEVGAVTSGSFGPSVQKTIGLGYVAAGTDTDNIAVQIRKKTVPAQVAALPFYPDGTARTE